jgi:hypothetical protein
MSKRHRQSQTKVSVDFNTAQLPDAEHVESRRLISRGGIGSSTHSAELQNDADSPIDVLRMPVRRQEPDISTRFVALKEWEGVVREIDEAAGVFWADLIDVSDPQRGEEQAEFELALVPEADRDLLRSGGIFRWVIGTRFVNDTRERSSRIVFRRLPAWTASELNSSLEEANALSRLLQRT